MANDLRISDEDLLENPTSRVPVVLCLDTSTSMAGEPIRELADGVELFYQSVFDHEVARFSAEIAVVTFGCDGVRRAVDFGPVEEPPQLDLRAGGNTPMGRGVGAALDMLEERKQAYRSAGVDYFQPWMVLMTDGAPTDSIDGAISRVVKLVESKRLTVFPIGIGEDAEHGGSGAIPSRSHAATFARARIQTVLRVAERKRSTGLGQHPRPGRSARRGGNQGLGNGLTTGSECSGPTLRRWVGAAVAVTGAGAP